MLDYTVEQAKGTPPLWLARNVVLTLIALASLTSVGSPAVQAASHRAQVGLASPTDEVPVALADCLTLFTPFAELPDDDLLQIADHASWLLGREAAEDIPQSIRSLGHAVDDWAFTHRA
jgi:hypothetical protein